MPRPFTRAQALQNAAFLERLALSGNVRLAAREVGVKYGTIQHRRGADAAFAQQWEAVLAAAHARFHLAGGKRGPEGEADIRAEARRRGEAGEATRPSRADGGQDRHRRAGLADTKGTGAESDGGGAGRGPSAPPRLGANPPAAARAKSPLHHPSGGPPPRPGEDLRTRGGEPVVVRTKTGKLQLRLAHRGKLTKAAEQAFLSALSATANIRLSAAAAGASPAAFYRRRKQNPAFDREFRLALEMGYERLEAAALRAALPQSHTDDQWRECAPPPIPPMSADQALQLLFLHEKSVRQGWERPHRRRRRGEPWETYTERLRAMWTAEKHREAEDAALRRAARYEESGDWRFADEAAPPPLPPLHLVTGWSKASGKPKHDPDVALFGGWRIREMRGKMGEKRG